MAAKKVLQIKPTKAQDLSTLVKIGKEIWPGERWLTQSYLKKTLVMPGIRYTAWHEGKVVGGIMAVENDWPKWWLFFFAVHPGKQRQGIGSALLAALEKKLPKNVVLFTDLEKSDVSGIRFYKKQGFRQMGTVKSWWGDTRAAIILAKKK